MPSPTQDSEPAAVLVVEDERELAETYARWLSDAYTVYTAYSGEEALETIDDGIDVVLLDRRLPGMKGREVLDTIRDRGYDCRVAMITAVDPDVDILSMAFDDYIVKPVLKDDLLEIVDRLLRLATYDDQFRECFSLASKLTTLRREKSAVELAESDEYAEVKARFETLRERIDATLAEFGDTDFATLYRDVSRAGNGEDGNGDGP